MNLFNATARLCFDWLLVAAVLLAIVWFLRRQ